MGLFVEISMAAEQDLEDVFDYSLQEHGLGQAVKYVSSFDEAFQNLTTYPEIGRARLEIRVGLRSILKSYHVIFYRILSDRIRIVRVLHRNRDLPRQFDYQTE